jgi:hypothetical protein
MTQYNRQFRSNRRKTRSGRRNDTGQNGFLPILLFYVLPFIVVNGLIFFLVTSKPKGGITIGESSDYISTTMELKIKSLLPVTDMEVTLDGSPVEMTKTGLKTYSAILTSNGVLEIKLLSFNKMKTVLDEQVDVLDDTPPIMKDEVIENGVLSFRLEDIQSGVDFSSISGYDENTQDIIFPLSIDQSTGRVVFELKMDNLTITAKDNTGNELHVTPQGESMGEEKTQDLPEEAPAES